MIRLQLTEGNLGNADDVAVLTEAAASPDPLVSEHASWAFGQLKASVRPYGASPSRSRVISIIVRRNPAPSKWEFTENGRDFAVDVRARVLTNDPALNIRLARAGAGLCLADDRMRDDVAKGDLVTVLDEFSTPFPGFYLYYPERRQASPALRALVDYLRDARKSGGRLHMHQVDRISQESDDQNRTA